MGSGQIRFPLVLQAGHRNGTFAPGNPGTAELKAALLDAVTPQDTERDAGLRTRLTRMFGRAVASAGQLTNQSCRPLRRLIRCPQFLSRHHQSDVGE